MSYANLMVHLEVGKSNADLLRVAGDLAQTFKAEVVGIGACQPMQYVFNDGYVPANLVQEDLDEMDKELKVAEFEFRNALHGRATSLRWKQQMTVNPLADYIAQEARGADLILTGVDRNSNLFDRSRHVAIGDLAMQAGRPLLIVPAMLPKIDSDRILVGWKDTRETRRAVADALPFLKMARHVAVVEIADDDGEAEARRHVGEVVAWLVAHGVVAVGTVANSTGDDAARLAAIADEQGADMIVAGAYGHSRVREWALGGVTRDLLLRAKRCTFISH